MRKWLKKYIWIFVAISLALVAFDLFSNIRNFLFFIGAIALMVGSFFISVGIKRNILFFLGLFILSNVLIDSYAFLGFMLIVLLLLAIFQTKEGNEIIWFRESYIYPFKNNKAYVGVKVVRPQIEQRSLVYKKSIVKQYEEKEIFEWDDINIVALGGDSIIDLGRTILPEGENVVVIRKLFGRTRVIVPHEIALKMNISLINGRVIYEQDEFSLLNDSFLWESPDYQKNNRKLKIMISSVFGDVEVIRL
ncbi:cell wall-active antibiotics response protein LiaF [Globicatella sanguinis]|uniref:cell wall-active antibiotics response protein LiaF n=1 Tax=Globicatella sanguinis TaxID=13076 RepID=UPI000826C62A|nr:cell wall-active antibiotics response protein LiaF [Globicatella sanguinis]MDK7630136.1 cell wall-active antibiotics response protein LiaF [Globicatella sanguinis]WIK66568.1 cell wall-active antibiotics response protein LiaF [Globicatella sanguinis]WKT55973.1 cell wall-active antibiotics response protein LiaF [Globicatella sanguinis]